MAQSKKKPFRFSQADDIGLLKEVLANNPYQGNGAGKSVDVAEELNKSSNMRVDGRSCRKRTTLLLEYFKKSDSEMQRR